MGAEKFPSTQAIRTLKKHKIDFSVRVYRCVEKGGTQDILWVESPLLGHENA